MKKKLFKQATVAMDKFGSSHTIWAILIVATLLAGCSTQQPPKPPTPAPLPAGAFPLNLKGSNSGAMTMPGSPGIPSYDSVVQQFPNSPPPAAAPSWPTMPGKTAPAQLPKIAGGPQSMGSIPSQIPNQVSAPKGPQLSSAPGVFKPCLYSRPLTAPHNITLT